MSNQELDEIFLEAKRLTYEYINKRWDNYFLMQDYQEWVELGMFPIYTSDVYHGMWQDAKPKSIGDCGKVIITSTTGEI